VGIEVAFPVDAFGEVPEPATRSVRRQAMHAVVDRI
jgi:hypothetical protein